MKFTVSGVFQKATSKFEYMSSEILKLKSSNANESLDHKPLWSKI